MYYKGTSCVHRIGWREPHPCPWLPELEVWNPVVVSPAVKYVQSLWGGSTLSVCWGQLLHTRGWMWATVWIKLRADG